MAETAVMNGIPRTHGRRIREIMCSFIVNGTAEPVLNSHASLGETGLTSFVRNGAGNYDGVTTDRWGKLVGVHAHYAATGAAEDMYAQASPPANIGSATLTATFSVRTKTAGTNTNPAASNNLLTVYLRFEDMPTAT